MKIKLAVFSEDSLYIEHLMNHMSIHYDEKLELSAFSDKNALIDQLKRHGVDVLLLDSSTRYVKDEISSSIVTAVLSDNLDDVEDDSQISVFKYQKGELVYRKILNLYATGTDKVPGRMNSEHVNETEVNLFFSMSGGAGTSTVAAAYAVNQSAKGNVLYLNMELYGNADVRLEGNGEFSFDDILYALKSRRGSLDLKLESAIRRNGDGVCYYAPPSNPLSMMELTKEEFKNLIEALKKSGLFKKIIIDMDSYPSPWMIESLVAADFIWLIADGSRNSNEKYQQFIKFITALEKKHQIRLIPKMKLFYNKFSSRNGITLDNCSLNVAGGSPKYEGMGEHEIIRRMAASSAFDKGAFG